MNTNRHEFVESPYIPYSKRHCIDDNLKAPLPFISLVSIRRSSQQSQPAGPPKESAQICEICG